MLAVTIDGYSLAAWVVLVVAILWLAIKMIRRNGKTRIARVGLFVERERFEHEDEHAWDPFAEHSPKRPAPIPPPTPPPPIPRAGDETQAWPQREEEP